MNLHVEKEQPYQLAQHIHNKFYYDPSSHELYWFLLVFSMQVGGIQQLNNVCLFDALSQYALLMLLHWLYDLLPQSQIQV